MRGQTATRQRQHRFNALLGAAVGAALASFVAAATVGAEPLARDRKPPRIVAAAMLDTDRDTHADRVRLTYSERVRHRADRDGRYPLSVAGYRIARIGAAAGRTLAIQLVEKTAPDHAARPAIRYGRTRVEPVTDRAGIQAIAQRFVRVRSHGRAPAPPPPPAPPPQPPAPARDTDRDGWDDTLDCAPNNPAVHPGAPDVPDLGLVDSNCDRLDGTEANAIFASPLGSDANPGTKARPKREIQAAVAAAAATGRYVLAANGAYGHVQVSSRVGIYGGYDPTSWARSAPGSTTIVGTPEGVLAVGATGVVLQLLAVRGINGGIRAVERSAYGIRAIEGSALRLERVSVAAGPGASGTAGTHGRPGADGGAGGRPDYAGPYCDWVDTSFDDLGGAGGDSPVGRTGGKGGKQGAGRDGGTGGAGRFGTPGGAGGKAGNPGRPGANGANGSHGQPGLGADGGGNSTALARATWVGVEGGFGRVGGAGNGGGGGGGGGGQTGVFVRDGTGNPGGGGGGGGGPGLPGNGGTFGGGSFGVYLYNSTLTADRSTIAAGDGGPGGRGGDGGPGGRGGAGAPGTDACTSEVGRGGTGGRGGNGGIGGAGGGGAGGPSVGVFQAGASSLQATGTTIAFGTPGAGGASGSGGATGSGVGSAGIARAVHP